MDLHPVGFVGFFEFVGSVEYTL